MCQCEANRNANDWNADSGIDIRQLVYGLLTVARAYTPETEDEDAAVKMLIIDAKDFLTATEPVEVA
jgi:hypothetical protein